MLLDHGEDAVGVETRGVDHHARLEAAAVGCGDDKARAAALDRRDLGAEAELGAVGAGDLGHGDRQLGRRDHGRVLRVKGELAGHVGFDGADGVAADDRKAAAAVPPALLEQLFQVGELATVLGDDELFREAVGHAELDADIGEIRGAFYIEARLEGTSLDVEAGMDDARVGLAGAFGHVAFLFQEDDVQRGEREFPGDRAADHASADDAHVVGH